MLNLSYQGMRCDMLILMRHGEADWNATTDESRCLTEKGISFVRQQAAEVAGFAPNVSKIICSPYRRTCQTARLMQQSLGGIEIVEDDRLTPDVPVSEAITALEAHWQDNLLVVTHQPLIGYLVSYLIEGDMRSPEPLLPGHRVSLALDWPAAGMATRLIEK